MKLDPRELRGVGIQITKLDGEKAVEKEAGQGTLSFGAKVKGDVPEKVEVEEVVSPAVLPIEAGPSRAPDIDPDFLAALPAELREEIERDHVRPLPVKRASTESVESPAKRGKHAAAHITRQLRPKVKTQMKAAAIADLPLYGAWAKAREAELVDLTLDEEDIGGYQVSELRELGIDPEVFTALPDDMRKEIITEERKKNRQRKILRRPADTSRLRARGATRTASLSPSSRGGSVPAHSRPLAAVSLPPKPALMKATALPDVLETMTRWIDSRKGGPPAAKDASRVQAYLVKCFDAGAALGAAEHAVEALKWMRLELRMRWPDKEKVAGREWWETWERFVEAVNRACILRFGAPMQV